MGILMLNLFVVYICSIFARLDFKNNLLKTNYKEYNKIFILLALISLICVSGFRYKSGTDYANYVENYTVFINTGNVDSSEMENIAFTKLCLFLSSISKDPQIMFLTTAAITNILIVLTLRKYSSSFELSMWLYITTYVYYSTFNGLRQWMASAIIFCGMKYLVKERNFIKYLAIVLFASLFHSTALVMIPVYFFIDSESFSKRNLYMLLAFMFAVFAYSKFLPILDAVLGKTSYSNYVEIFNNDTNGINPLRLAVYFAPVGVSLLFYKNLNQDNNIEVDRLLNLCIIGFLIMFMALRQVFFARLVYYFDVYYLLLIPKLIDIGDIKLKRFMYYSIITGYFAFSYMLLKAGDAWIVPYTFKITLF